MTWHIDRPLIGMSFFGGVCVWTPPPPFFFSCLEEKHCSDWDTGEHGPKKGADGATDVPDRPSVKCSILCLCRLNQYLLSVPFLKFLELWTTTEEVLSSPRPRHMILFSFFLLFYGFAREEVFFFCFLVLSMVLRLDAEHIENKPTVGRRRVHEVQKRRLLQFTERTSRPLYSKENLIYHNDITVCSESA